MKKQTGIWLDLQEADVIELQDGDLVNVRRIKSNIDTSKAKGGARAGGRMGGGTMMGVSEKTKTNRKMQQERNYFDEVLENVRDADEVVIFGPGQAKDMLLNTIKEHPSHFNSDLMAVLTADSMTENQKVAYVKTFFEAN